MFDLSVANAPAAGVFACLLMNPSQDYSHLKDRRAAIQAASYRGLQAPSTQSSTPGNMVVPFDYQSKNVASITPYGVEFRLITPAGLPFASHATDQLDYLAGEVRVVTSPAAAPLPATIVGFSTWQRVDFNSVNNRLRGKGAKGFLPSSTLAVTFEQRTEAAGIAPEVAVSQDISEHSSCVNCPPPCLHTVCEDAALPELVANWHRLTPSVRTAILDQVAQLVTDSSALGVP